MVLTTIMQLINVVFGIEQFIYDLPERLGKCIKSGAYADAVKFYTGAMPIFKVFPSSWILMSGLFPVLFLTSFM